MVQNAISNKKKKNKVKKNCISHLDANEFMASIGDDEIKEELITSPETTSSIMPRDEVSGKNVQMGLAKLEKQDSEFYKFLQENDPELLNFSGDDSDVSEDDSEVDEVLLESDNEEDDIQSADSMVFGDEPDHVNAGHDTDVEKDSNFNDDIVISPDLENTGADEQQSIPITKSLTNKWEKGLKKNSLNTWKQVVKGFHAAVVSAQGDAAEVKLKYSVLDPDIVNSVITLALQYSCEVLSYNLGAIPTVSPKWAKIKVSLKSYLSDVLELLGLLTSSDVLCAVMRHCKALLPYFTAFSRLLKKFVKSHVKVWGSNKSLSQVVAFTSIQALVTRVPTFLEDVTKKMYVEYKSCCKIMTQVTHDSILLMRNCLVEILKINPSLTYSTGFIYIRDLAVTLRSVMIKNKPIQTVYNWQFINCLHLWVSVLCECDACLQPLTFPLIQIMMGVINLQKSPLYFPLHLHTIRLMLHLAAETDKHIPLIHPLLNILQFCSTKHKSVATKPIDLTCVLKVTKNYKNTKAYQDGIFELTYELILNYVSNLSHSISFPEVSFPITIWLKKFNKSCENSKYKLHIKQIIDKIDIVASDLSNLRSNVSFSPKDLNEVSKWEKQLPESSLVKYFKTWLNIHRTVQKHEFKRNEEPLEPSEDEKEEPKPKKAKKSKKKVDKNTLSETKPTEEINKYSDVDNGDLIEDMVLSD